MKKKYYIIIILFILGALVILANIRLPVSFITKEKINEISYNKTKHLNYPKLIKENVDHIYDYKNKIVMHPGVTYAVNKIFGNIQSYNGLFIQKIKKRAL